MKRVITTDSEGAIDEVPLRKKTTSLFSIATIYEDSSSVGEANDDTGLIQRRSAPTSRSNSSVGLDLMMTDNVNNNIGGNDDYHDDEEKCKKEETEFLPEVFIQPPSSYGTTKKSNNNLLPPSVTPPSLSCTEDNSCYTEDEEEDDRNENENNVASSLLPDASTMVKPSCLTTTLKSTTTEGIVISKDVVPTSHNTDFRTGIVFETGSNHFDRHNRFHKERPVRITCIQEALKKSNDDVLSRCCVLGESSSPAAITQTNDDDDDDDEAQKIPTQSATKFLDDEDYLRVHLPGYMQRLDKLFNCNCCDDDRLDREAEQYQSIYFTKDTLKEAKTAAASLCSLVENVVLGDLDNGFAVIRPPGHHAEPGLAGGYCIINNIAVAASYAREKMGVDKVLIVDWDVHHGNGTQSIFIKDPNVLYFSTHRWHGGNFFPFLSNGGPTSVGIGDGEGFNMNVGWTAKGMGDDEYLAVWERLLLPVAEEFQPDLILVSAGFDAADGDLGECHITPECYGRLTRSLMTLKTPIVCALEGGYVRSILGKCVCSVVSALLDRNSFQQSQLEDNENRRERGNLDVLDTISTMAAKNVRATIAAHKSYWSCLRA